MKTKEDILYDLGLGLDPKTDSFILEAMEEYAQEVVKNLNIPAVSGSLPLIEFIEEIEYMMKLYGNQRYTQAEAQRDKLAEKLDDIMRLGGNDC
jgi:hypothetical protein